MAVQNTRVNKSPKKENTECENNESLVLSSGCSSSDLRRNARERVDERREALRFVDMVRVQSSIQRRSTWSTLPHRIDDLGH